jgi:tripartite-type tricarboxylate transporter receptor subunit TctC
MYFGYIKNTFTSLGRLSSLVVAAMLIVAGVSSAHAAWKPTDTVTIVVPFGPGGSADRTARMIHRILTKEKIVDAKIVVAISLSKKRILITC